MKLTNKEYLVDIILKSLKVKPTKYPSKISCQVHYGDNYLKMKIQPSLKNGIANFYDERIRIPYAPDVALVFKSLKNDKRQDFLGHYPLQLQKYLKNNQLCLQVKDQDLEETNAKVSFQCRIIDKALFNSDSEEIQEEDITSPKKGANFSINEPKFRRKPMSIKPLSELDKPFVFVKKGECLNILLNEQYSRQLQTIEEIMHKKQKFEEREEILRKYDRNQQNQIRSFRLVELENNLLKKREDERMNSFLLYSLVGGLGFLFGFMAT